MAYGTGLASFVGYKAESSVGTYAAPDRFVPSAKETMSGDPQIIKAAGIIPGRIYTTSQQVVAGAYTVGGNVEHELYQAGLGYLLKHTLGANTTTGAGPYTHAIRNGDLYGLGLTVGVGVPGAAGTVRYKAYTGCKVKELAIGIVPTEVATLSVDFVGMTEDLGQSAPSPSYTDDKQKPYTASDCTVEVGGNPYPVRNAQIKITNPLAEDRRSTGKRTIDEPLQSDRRMITVEMEVDFTTWTAYQSVIDRDEVAFEFAFASGTNSLTIAGNGLYTGGTPVVEGTGIVPQTFTLEVVADGTDAAAFTIDMVNSESAI